MMARSLKLAAVALVAMVALWACNGGATGPKDVADKFLSAYFNGDFETAKQYATEETKSVLDMMNSEDMSGETASYNITDVKEEEATATVSYTVEGVEGTQTLNLKKVENDWKVEMTKLDAPKGPGADDEGESMMPEGGEEMPADTMGTEMETEGEEVEE